MDSDGVNLQRVAEACSMVLGTVLGAGWLPSTVYHLAKKVRLGRTATPPRRQSCRNVREDNGQVAGASRE